MSSDSLLTLPQPLTRHRRQMMLLIVRNLALPHDEDDLQPFCPQRAERLTVRMPPRALLVVVRSRPLTRQHRKEGHLIDHVPQGLIAGEAELDHPLFATAFRDGHGASVGLEMAKRFPPSRGISQAGPERWRGDAVLTDRQGPGPLRHRHNREKIVDRLPVLRHGGPDGPEL